MKLPEHFKGHHLKRLIMMLALIPSALIYLTACGSQDSSAVNAFSGSIHINKNKPGNWKVSRDIMLLEIRFICGTITFQ